MGKSLSQPASPSRETWYCGARLALQPNGSGHARAKDRIDRTPTEHEPWGVRRFFVTDPNSVVVNVVNHQK
jgi:hypothetical protein